MSWLSSLFTSCWLISTFFNWYLQVVHFVSCSFQMIPVFMCWSVVVAVCHLHSSNISCTQNFWIEGLNQTQQSQHLESKTMVTVQKNNKSYMSLKVPHPSLKVPPPFSQSAPPSPCAPPLHKVCPYHSNTTLNVPLSKCKTLKVSQSVIFSTNNWCSRYMKFSKCWKNADSTCDSQNGTFKIWHSHFVTKATTVLKKPGLIPTGKLYQNWYQKSYLTNYLTNYLFFKLTIYLKVLKN